MKLKFGIVGPSGAGKTLIANILGNEMSMENSVGRPPYRPTNSVRILEFSVPNVDMRKFSTEVDVQIWEIGGNPRLKSIWPGVQLNLDGIILVYDTNNELHVRDMSALHMHFVTHSNLSPAQCLIIGNQFRGQRESGPAKIVGIGPRVRHCVVNVDDDPNYLRDEFRNFLTGAAQVSIEQEHNPNPMSGFIAGIEPRSIGGGDARPTFSVRDSARPPHVPIIDPNSHETYEVDMNRRSHKTKSRRREVPDDGQFILKSKSKNRNQH